MQPGHVTDESLMGQVARGQHESLDILVRRYASPLLTFITRMIGDRHRGEELFQEVFLTVWIKRGQYNESLRFRPWLYQIAINKCRASFRRRSIPVASSVSIDLAAIATDMSPSGSDAAVATETGRLVIDAVATLPDKQRMVLVLRNWSKLSYAEIAAILNCGESTVRSNMFHALAGLRAYLEPRMP